MAALATAPHRRILPASYLHVGDVRLQLVQRPQRFLLLRGGDAKLSDVSVRYAWAAGRCAAATSATKRRGGGSSSRPCRTSMAGGSRYGGQSGGRCSGRGLCAVGDGACASAAQDE